MNFKKLLSVLLATVLVMGLLATAASAYTLPNLGMNGSYAGMPSDAENVKYLSDIYNSNVVDQVNNSVQLDKGYHDYLYVFTAGKRWVIQSSNTDANGNRTLENGVTYHKNEIALGYNGTKFEKGLGVHPSAPGQPDRYIVYDVSKLDVNRFYAVVGGTGEKITIPDAKNHYLEFELLGSKESSYKADKFESLAIASQIRSYLSAEFDVDITGYNYIKLVIRATGVDNSSCGGAWGGACVYKGTGNPAATGEPLNYTPSADGLYAGIPSEHMANSGLLSSMDYVESSNNNGNPSTLDQPYGDANNLITIGDLDTTFWNGIGMHPKTPKDGESWTIYDVSGLNCDRFYSAVGITNPNGKAGAGSGVIFRVYGDYGDGKYTLLAQSDIVKNKMSGEFDIDISGVKLLKLVVVCGGSSHASSACAWADASVYSTSGTPNLPTEPEPTVKPTTPATKPTTAPTTAPTTESLEKGDASGEAFPWGIVIGIVAAVAVAAGVVVVVIILKKKKAE
ncbi:MAG: hypothetical protein E7439_05620 [Ruminococcaceae bacterium]|nr:hypothetical protein [Oscillospiraceae bacterium]